MDKARGRTSRHIVGLCLLSQVQCHKGLKVWPTGGDDSVPVRQGVSAGNNGRDQIGHNDRASEVLGCPGSNSTQHVAIAEMQMPIVGLFDLDTLCHVHGCNRKKRTCGVGNETMRIDLNADLGESFGAYTIGADAALLDIVSSANVACGFHASDPTIMVEVCQMAADKGVSIGAHPGFDDKQGFGRREIDMAPKDIEAMVAYQIGALQAAATIAGASIEHVKPHGALYIMAETRPHYAQAIARACKAVVPHVPLFASPGSEVIAAGEALGLHVALEGYADRRYVAKGTLKSRKLPGAVYTDTAQVIAQAMQIVRDQRVTGEDGTDYDTPCVTLCLHGDTPGAVEHARQVRAGLEAQGVEITAKAKF